MKKLFLIFVLFLNIFSISNAETGNINKPQENINIQLQSINTKVDNYKITLNDKITETYQKCIDSSNSIISNGLTNQGIILALFSLIFALIGIVLGYYVNKKLNLIDEKNSEIKENRKIIENIKVEIDSYPELFYKKIQEEETKYMINRLQNIPNEIEHFFHLLTTRYIDIKFFNDFKNLYELNKNLNFLTLIFQHFSLKLFLDNDLWNDFIANNTPIKRSFPNEREDFISIITKFYLNNENVYKDKYIELLKLLKNNNYLDEQKEFIETLFNENGKNDLYQELINNL